MRKTLGTILLSLGVILALAAALPVELTFGNSKAPPSRSKLSDLGTFGGASTTDSGSWTIVPSPNTGDQYNYLTGVTAISSSDAWAVGTHQVGTPAAESTLVEHWDGTAWSIVASPSPEPFSRLFGVDAVASDDVWAVGESGATGCKHALIEHWDGTSWSVVSDSVCGHLRAVKAIFANDVWAVGDGTGRTMHWDGTAWSVVPSPDADPSASSHELTAVDAAASDDVWAGARDGVLHWNGSAWSVSLASASTCCGSFFFPLAVGGVNDVWYASGQQPATMRHWDGSSWSAVASAAADFIPGMSAVSSSNVWAVGFNLPVYSGTTFTEQWDGTSWTAVPSPNVSGVGNELLAIATLPDGSAWAVGQLRLNTGGDFSQTLIERFTPSSTGNPFGDSLVGGGSKSMLYACSDCGDPINTATGEFFHTWNQLSIPGRGVPFAFSQTYSSARVGQDSPLGFGWTDSYNLSLSFDNSGNATVHEETGSQVTFALSAGPTYTPPAYVLATLVKNGDGSYTFTRDQTQISYVFDSSGKLIRELDRNGYQTSLTYDGSGHLISVTDPAGRSITFTYGGNGKIASLTDAGGRSVQFAYDSSGNLTHLTDIGGGGWSFSYDSSHRMLSMTDPRAGGTSNVYDSSGRVTSQTDALGRVTSFSYNTGSGGSETTVVTDPAGHKTQLVYQNLLLTEQTRGFGSSSAATTHYTYDTDTLGVTSETDPNGHTTTAIYDARGNLLSRTDPLGRTWSFTYNSFNKPLTKTDPLGVTTTYTYDGRANLTSASTPIGAQVSRTTYSYGDTSHPGDVTAMTDPDGHTWNFAYDGQGDRIRVTDPLGNVTTFAYNVLGELTSTVTPKGNIQNGNPAAYRTTFSYNAFGDMASKTDPLGHTTTYNYDPNRNLTATRDPDGHTTSYSYDADNERTAETLPDGSTSRTHFNGDGTIEEKLDGLGDTTSFTYDALARMISMTDPLNRTTSYTYDAAGNMTTLTDPAGPTTSYSHDAANELTGIAYSDVNTHNVSFTYDDDGRRLSMKDGTGTTSYTYDALGRLTDSTNGAGAHIAYGYDLAGNIIRITYPGGNVVTRTYDQDNRFAAVHDWLGHTTSFSYDPNANVTRQAYPNGVTAAFSYDRADRLLSIKDVKGGKSLMSLAYQRNADGLVSTENATTFGYDAANRVTTGGTLTYGYNAADELTRIGQATLAYNNANELTSLNRGSGSTAFSYDPQGNRTGAIPSAGPHVTYAYDQANRVVSFTRQATNGQGVTAASYTYNGDGLRMRKSVNGVTSAFAWDTAQKLPLLLRDGTTSYVTGPRGLPLEQVSSSGTVLYYHTDQLGSTRMLTDASGKIAASYNYDAYGNASANAGTIANPFGFAGQYADAESGLIYMRARSYDPTTGQFLSKDPLASLPDSYTYVADEPVNGADPSGLAGEKKTITRLNGTVEYRHDADQGWTGCMSQCVIDDTDWVRTREGSVGRITFPNGRESAQLYERTVAQVGKVAPDHVSLKQLWARVCIAVKHFLGNPVPVDIDTPSAVVSVKG